MGGGGASRGPWPDDAVFLTESHEGTQTLELCGKHAASERCQSIVAAALIVCIAGPTARLVDELVVLEAADRAIETSRLERNVSAGVREHILSDAIPMSLTSGEHREDEYFDRFEREQRLWCRAIDHASSRRGYRQNAYMCLTVTRPRWFNREF